MVLSKRERYVGIGTGAAIAILLIDQFLLSPYLARVAAISKDRAELSQRLVEADTLYARQRRLRPIWNDIQHGGLTANPSEAESQAQQAVLDWAQAAGVFIESRKPERTTTSGKFQVISFHVTGIGPMRAVSRLLWSLETAPIPVRVTEIHVTPRKEGADDLSVQLSISTLCLLPDSDKLSKSVASAADFGGLR